MSGAAPGAGMLAGLVAQAEAEGARMVTLRALVEEASEVGAQRALEMVGRLRRRRACRCLLPGHRRAGGGRASN